MSIIDRSIDASNGDGLHKNQAYKQCLSTFLKDSGSSSTVEQLTSNPKSKAYPIAVQGTIPSADRKRPSALLHLLEQESCSRPVAQPPHLKRTKSTSNAASVPNPFAAPTSGSTIRPTSVPTHRLGTDNLGAVRTNAGIARPAAAVKARQGVRRPGPGSTARFIQQTPGPFERTAPPVTGLDLKPSEVQQSIPPADTSATSTSTVLPPAAFSQQPRGQQQQQQPQPRRPCPQPMLTQAFPTRASATSTSGDTDMLTTAPCPSSAHHLLLLQEQRRQQLQQLQQLILQRQHQQQQLQKQFLFRQQAAPPGPAVTGPPGIPSSAGAHPSLGSWAPGTVQGAASGIGSMRPQKPSSISITPPLRPRDEILQQKLMEGLMLRRYQQHMLQRFPPAAAAAVPAGPSTSTSGAMDQQLLQRAWLDKGALSQHQRQHMQHQLQLAAGSAADFGSMNSTTEQQEQEQQHQQHQRFPPPPAEATHTSLSLQSGGFNQPQQRQQQLLAMLRQQQPPPQQQQQQQQQQEVAQPEPAAGGAQWPLTHLNLLQAEHQQEFLMLQRYRALLQVQRQRHLLLLHQHLQQQQQQQQLPSPLPPDLLDTAGAGCASLSSSSERTPWAPDHQQRHAAPSVTAALVVAHSSKLLPPSPFAAQAHSLPPSLPFAATSWPPTCQPPTPASTADQQPSTAFDLLIPPASAQSSGSAAMQALAAQASNGLPSGMGLPLSQAAASTQPPDSLQYSSTLLCTQPSASASLTRDRAHQHLLAMEQQQRQQQQQHRLQGLQAKQQQQQQQEQQLYSLQQREREQYVQPQQQAVELEYSGQAEQQQLQPPSPQADADSGSLPRFGSGILPDLSDLTEEMFARDDLAALMNPMEAEDDWLLSFAPDALPEPPPPPAAAAAASSCAPAAHSDELYGAAAVRGPPGAAAAVAAAAAAAADAGVPLDLEGTGTVARSGGAGRPQEHALRSAADAASEAAFKEAMRCQLAMQQMMAGAPTQLAPSALRSTGAYNPYMPPAAAPATSASPPGPQAQRARPAAQLVDLGAAAAGATKPRATAPRGKAAEFCGGGMLRSSSAAGRRSSAAAPKLLEFGAGIAARNPAQKQQQQQGGGRMQLFDHYADGNATWDGGMLGVDCEGIGWSGDGWEGCGTSTLL